MQILLRHALTGQYYASNGKWTANPSQAHDFGIIEAALTVARNSKCPNLEIDLSFENPRKRAAFRLMELFAGA